MRTRGRLGGWLLVAVVTVAACSGGDQAPSAGDDDVAAGKAVFDANCATCHGPQAEGTATGPPLVHIYYEPSHHDDDAFRSAMANGVVPHHWEFGPMPAFPGLAEDDREAVIAYIRSLQREAGIE